MAYECAFKNFKEKDREVLEAAERKFEDAVREGDLIKITEADERFHFAIYDAANNDKLSELLQSLKENMYRYRMEYSKDVAARSILIEEHRQIYDSFINRDYAAGLKVVERHIKNQEDTVLEKISKEY